MLKEECQRHSHFDPPVLVLLVSFAIIATVTVGWIKVEGIAMGPYSTKLVTLDPVHLVAALEPPSRIVIDEQPSVMLVEAIDHAAQ